MDFYQLRGNMTFFGHDKLAASPPGLLYLDIP